MCNMNKLSYNHAENIFQQYTESRTLGVIKANLTKIHMVWFYFSLKFGSSHETLIKNIILLRKFLKKSKKILNINGGGTG